MFYNVFEKIFDYNIYFHQKILSFKEWKEALSITLVMNALEVSLHPVFGFERKSCPSSFKSS